MGRSAGATKRRRARRQEQRKEYFVGQDGVIGYWACCGKEYLARTLQHARKLLECHEHDHHKKKTHGSYGVRRGELGTLYPETKPGHITPRLVRKGKKKIWQILPRLAKNGMIRLDLNQPDEVCLLPKKWGGRYPQTSNPGRLRKLSEQQNHRCCYCGKHTWSMHYGEDGIWQDMSTIEHIQCRVHGGTNKKGNLVMACSECNNLRARSNPIVFMYEKWGRLNWELVPKSPPAEVSEPPASKAAS